MIGNIQQVLNINRQTNRVTSLLVHALYIEIHFITISKIERAISITTNIIGAFSSCGIICVGIININYCIVFILAIKSMVFYKNNSLDYRELFLFSCKNCGDWEYDTKCSNENSR